MINKGILIAIEGIDNAGKTSAVEILRSELKDCKAPVTCCGELESPLAPLLILMVQTNGSSFLKTFMFALDRAWTYESTFLPAMHAGSLVIWDRYVDSAIAYRSAEFVVQDNLINIDFVKSINAPFAQPDLTILLDIDVETSFKRAQTNFRRMPYDREFLSRVKKEYDLLSANTCNNYVKVDASRSTTEVAEEISKIIRTRFPELF